MLKRSLSDAFKERILKGPLMMQKSLLGGINNFQNTNRENEMEMKWKVR